MVEEEKVTEEHQTYKVRVSCPDCQGRQFKVTLTQDMIDSIESFPFEVVLMHIAGSEKRTVHTLIAYIDKNLECHHSVCLTGRRVIITPYILYNPNLLYFSCYQKGVKKPQS